MIGDSKKGYIKFVDGVKKDADVLEYSNDKITYFDKIHYFMNVSNNILSYKLNDNIKIKYFYSDDIVLVNQVYDKLYFIYKDKLYRYSNGKYDMIAHYFEFNFNNKDNVFVYYE